MSVVLVRPMRITRSPSRSPAAFAGLTVLPSGAEISEKPTISAPSENIRTPKGVPQTVTSARRVITVRTFRIGSQPPSDSVVW